MCGYLACYEPGPTPSTMGCADVWRIVTIVVCYWADNGSTIIEDPKYMQNLVSDCIRNSKRFIGNVNNAYMISLELMLPSYLGKVQANP